MDYGWYKEADYTTAWNFATETVETNTTIYAKWAALPPDCVVALTWSATATALVKDIAMQVVEGKQLTVSWGDGSVENFSGTGAANLVLSHSYAAEGSYLVTLTATDPECQLTYLNVANRQLSALDISRAKSLQVLHCQYNQIRTLYILGSPLRELNVRGNPLTSKKFLHPTLRILSV